MTVGEPKESPCKVYFQVFFSLTSLFVRAPHMFRCPLSSAKLALLLPIMFFYHWCHVALMLQRPWDSRTDVVTLIQNGFRKKNYKKTKEGFSWNRLWLHTSCNSDSIARWMPFALLINSLEIMLGFSCIVLLEQAFSVPPHRSRTESWILRLDVTRQQPGQLLMTAAHQTNTPEASATVCQWAEGVCSGRVVSG